MEFNFSSFFLDNLEAAGAIAGYVSLSIIGFALISFGIKKRNFFNIMFYKIKFFYIEKSTCIKIRAKNITL